MMNFERLRAQAYTEPTGVSFFSGAIPMMTESDGQILTRMVRLHKVMGNDGQWVRVAESNEY